MILALVLLMVVGASGCTASRGFDRVGLQAMLQADPDVVTERDIAAVLGLKPDLSLPFRMALYFTTGHAPFQSALQRPDWLGEDKDQVLDRLRPLNSEAILSSVFILAESTVQGTLNRDIRLAAARYNADVLLIVNGAAAVDRYNNGYAAWYATGLGAYLAPGTHSDALFMIEGTLWDVRSGYLYGTQSAEGTARSVGPAAYLEDKHVVARAKAAALESFADHLADLLRRMKESFAQPSPR